MRSIVIVMQRGITRPSQNITPFGGGADATEGMGLWGGVSPFGPS